MGANLYSVDVYALLEWLKLWHEITRFPNQTQVSPRVRSYIHLTLFGVLFNNNITHLSTARRVGTNSLLSCEVSTVRTEPRSKLYSTVSTSQSIFSEFFVGRSGVLVSLSSSVVIRSRTRWLTLFATSFVSCLELGTKELRLNLLRKSGC